MTKKIPLSDEFILNLDSLFEANCFWGIPIIPHSSLDPVQYTLEINDPKLEECLNRSYYIVDLIGLDESYGSLDSICNKIMEVIDAPN